MTVPTGISSDKWSERLIDRLAYAHDASMYRLVPEAVVRPGSEKDVISLLNYSNDTKTPLTFRTGGTSLSGQSITNGILAEIVRGWQGYKILDNGNAIQMQPGVIGARANLYLSPYCKRIGPDPASISAARIGGIISNNSSGMSCGVQYNAYHTMKNIRFLLANGKIYDTRIEDDYMRFVKDESDLANGLLQCKKRIESKPNLINKIRSKYRIKNTLGYSLNALIDYDHPLDIFSHLIVGSEGTLAFFSEVELTTIDDPPFKTTGLVLFDSVEASVSALPILVDEAADAIEMLDDASLRTAIYLNDPPYNPHSIKDGSAALLFEFQKPEDEYIKLLNQHIPNALMKAGGQLPLGMTDNLKSRSDLWNIRKGLYPTVGAMRAKGTSVITEDLCYDYHDLPDVVNELKKICSNWHYNDAVIFGHAKDGNLHFAASMDLNTEDGANRFEGLLKDMADLTVGKFNGSLKAEHGTGRNMASFVEYEWGGELYQIMWEIKGLADPNHILNPDVLLTNDDRLHLKNLKKIPVVDDSIDLCVECGFCEPVCPSKELTMTPRQRIAVKREITMGYANDSVVEDYDYDGKETCATDGLCEIACPVNINTGTYIKSLRSEDHNRLQISLSQWVINHFAFVQSLARAGLKIGKIGETYLGIEFMKGLSKIMRSLLGTPHWHSHLPEVASSIKTSDSVFKHKWIYYPSCLTRIFGQNGGKSSLGDIVRDIGKKTGQEVYIPDEIDSTCCSQPFASKGFIDSARTIQERTIQLLWDVSDNGKFPIIIDTSPCTYQLLYPNSKLSERGSTQLDNLKIVDLANYLTECVQSVDTRQKLQKTVALHPTCSTEKMGETENLRKLAELCVKKVIIPKHWGCCGFAGDKGLNSPELNASAVSMAIKDISDLKEGYSSSTTCEMGMSSQGNTQFKSIALLVWDYLAQPVN